MKAQKSSRKRTNNGVLIEGDAALMDDLRAQAKTIEHHGGRRQDVIGGDDIELIGISINLTIQKTLKDGKHTSRRYKG